MTLFEQHACTDANTNQQGDARAHHQETWNRGGACPRLEAAETLKRGRVITLSSE